MKKLLFTVVLAALVLPFTAAQGKLEVGQKAPEWVLTDVDKKEFTMNSWPGKVLQINYVDPDNDDLNDPSMMPSTKPLTLTRLLTRTTTRDSGS